MSLLKQLFYGILINHHVKKANKYSDYTHLSIYHFQISCYYYEKAYGEKFKDEKEVMTMLRKL